MFSTNKSSWLMQPLQSLVLVWAQWQHSICDNTNWIWPSWSRQIFLASLMSWLSMIIESQHHLTTHKQQRCSSRNEGVYETLHVISVNADVCRFARVYINGWAWLTARLPVLTQCDWVGDVSALCCQRPPFVTISSRWAPVGPESSCLPRRNPALSMCRHVYGHQQHPSHGN